MVLWFIFSNNDVVIGLGILDYLNINNIFLNFRVFLFNCPNDLTHICILFNDLLNRIRNNFDMPIRQNILFDHNFGNFLRNLHCFLNNDFFGLFFVLGHYPLLFGGLRVLIHHNYVLEVFIILNFSIDWCYILKHRCAFNYFFSYSLENLVSFDDLSKLLLIDDSN